MRKIFILFVGCIIGIIVGRNKEHLINTQFIRDYFHFRPTLKNKEALLKADQVMVLLAFGQSNSANYGGGSYEVRNEVYNYYKGDLYKSIEPLLGPDGKGCSVWTRVGDMLIDSGYCKKVIIVPFGVGGTSIKSWVSGKQRGKLNDILAYLKKDTIVPTHILWLQGETDNVDKTTKAEYKSQLNELVSVFREQGIKSPFFTSLTSYFPFNNDNYLGVDAQIIEAQKEVAAQRGDVEEGPNTDLINLAYYRLDGVHMTEKGLDQLALGWYNTIKTYQELKSR